jgi:hypothetical protein
MAAAMMLVAAVLGSAALAQLGRGPVRRSTELGGTIGTVVNTPAELARAIAASVPGAIIRLAGGGYGQLKLARGAGNGVTLVSADTAHPARFDAVDLNGVNKITIRDVDVARTRESPVPLPYIVSLVNVSGIRLLNLRIIGTGGEERGRQYGVWIRGSDNVSLTGSVITGTRYGIGTLANDHVEIIRNEIRDLQTDGIRGGGTDDLLIAENVLGHFTPKEKEHPDAIQLWSTRETEPARRIVIRDNLIVRDGGGIIQGIFVRDTFRKLPFEDLTVSSNLVIGSMYNGIAVSGMTRGTIHDNEVVAYPDMKSWISLNGATDVSFSDNRAMLFILKENRGLTDRRNRTTSPRKLGDLQRVAAWLDAHPSLISQGGPYLKQLANAGKQ